MLHEEQEQIYQLLFKSGPFDEVHSKMEQPMCAGGSGMKCLACEGEMRLMEVRTDTTTVCGIERHTFRCSACAHTAQRLMLNRVRMPITKLPVVARPKAIDLQMGRPAAGSGWGMRSRSSTANRPISSSERQ
jgi:hypothetical protein